MQAHRYRRRLMTSRTSYFRRRRLRLLRARLCTRCGDEPAKTDHKLCAACLAVETAKKLLRREDQKRREMGVLRRAAALEKAAAALRARLAKVA
jgi:hypothetical protein